MERVTRASHGNVRLELYVPLRPYACGSYVWRKAYAWLRLYV